MSDGGADFEAKLDRIDAIVKELENPDTKLERAIALFKEGKVLARECEALLKNAQTQIDEAMSERQRGKSTDDAKREEVDDQIPF
ncbi:MAG TPA: exodeoxyribonuclease VII small subunit [Candidatus Cybelea sp.]|jgi:exodeoxyribonuclease VII small subunit|nr:exodeoxyribonuclease VII small subunit [Candidatus Cybelea sp.]